MHKLKLDLDQLSVESFDTNPPEGTQRGTVKGHSHVCVSPFDTCAALSCNYTCGTCDPSCASCASCFNTCYDTCGASCFGTCATCQTNCQQESCVYACP
ncbi:MAG: hypothetical protein JWM27_198 [Gemmatimonadetes bacterium]|nr:hypothetical protein [Gemmatimonadota bacterium]